jgi:hypothetical protein
LHKRSIEVARQTEFAIEHGRLGDPEPDLGLTEKDLRFLDDQHKTRVKVLIDGATADVTDAKADLIKVKAPPEGDGPWAIVLTTQDEKTVLGVFDLNYDPKKGTFEVKQQEAISDPPDD